MPTRRDRRRQARHHFTQLDQVTQLVAAREADPDLGFMARLLALCSLPRTNPKNQHEFKRVNGPYTLYMVAGGGNKLPYGTLPRLLLAWVCTEAVRTQSPELILGDSLSAFMRKVGIYSTSGDKHTRLRNQMRRLFGCTVSLLYEDARGEATLNAPIARLTEFWWSERQPDARSLWESKIELGEDFFNEIIRCPIPIDLNTLRPMKPVERHGFDPEVAAELGHGGVAARHRGLGQPHLGFRQRERPAAVVVSICAPCPVRTRRPTPRADRTCTVLTRWTRVRPRRSSFQTTSTSPVRSSRTQLSSPGRSSRTPDAKSW